ncbi:MAG: sucrase ferredoxin, partial [Thermoleophilia bacterium]|nr:sucrase ferredoxin [Thermoleophilia bacterium]
MSQASAAPLRCSYAADERGDPLAATAAPANGFLLIESPGAWGHDILSQSRLDPEIAALVAARAVGLSYRLILIKRPGRVRPHGPRRWVLVDSAPGAERMTWGAYDADSDLLEIPLEHTEHEEAPTPLYLVCTHGRHDACCAKRGRPVAATLSERRPESVWECSHIGGDRFAPN